MKHRYLEAIVVVGSLLILFSLSRSVYTTWRKQDLVKVREAVLSQVEEENARLKGKLTLVQSGSYIEKVAREKLGFAKPDEVIVLLPLKTESELVSQTTVKAVPPWKQWWQLVF